MPDPPKFVLTPKDRAQAVRACRKRDRLLRQAQADANSAVQACQDELDGILDKYDLPYQAKDVDLTTGEIYSTVEKPPGPPALPRKA